VTLPASSQNRRLDLYVAAVATTGLAVVAVSALGLPATPHRMEWLLIGLLALVAGRFALNMPGINARFSVSDTFFITSALLFGPGPATLTIAIDSLAMSYGRRYPLRNLLFNGSGPAIAFWVACQVFFQLAGTGPLFGSAVQPDRIVLPLAALAGVYYLLNSGLTAMAVGLETRTSPLAVWRGHFAVVSLNFFGAASAAFLLVIAVGYVSLIALAAVIPLFAIFHLAMKSWTGRLEDANRHVAKVDSLYLSTIGALSTAIEAKDGVTSSHIHRVQHYAMGLAKALGGLDEQTLKAIQAAALLHDTGKLAVPERILNKPGKLTTAEFETMKLHVDAGADILSSIDFPYPVVPIVRAHHENWDGTGYPNGVKGTDIPIGARILSVVDCYDALTSDRPYRVAMSDDEALAIIRARRGSFYDPAIVDTFERVCRDIGPMPVKPQMQKAIQQISRAAALPQRPVLVPMPAPAPMTEGPDALRALANLARIVSGKPGATDVASMIWSHVRHVVPNASCAFFLNEPASDSVKVKFVAGDASSALQGLEMKLGDRLTGWVAENQQAIVNSEAKLDLGPEAAFVGLNYCVSLPLVSDGQLAGVLSLYAADPFRDEQIHTLQSVLPHLALMFLSLETRADSGIGIAPARQPLRVVSSR
jgi:putative nucleotidyltransferase with HDIG domain